MKNTAKQIGKALCYFMLYFLGQILITLIVQIICGYTAGYDAGVKGLTFETQEQLVEYANNFYFSNMGIDLAARAVFTLLFLLVFFLIRKKKVTEELDIRKTSGKKMIAAALGALFVIFFVNNVMGLLVPEDSLEAFEEASSALYAYPLWQAILANVILVPILEEVIFRGLLFSRLLKAMPSVVVALITSIIFSLMHGQIVWMIFAFVVGMLLSFVRIKSGSITPTILMHVMINGYATLVSYEILTFSSPVVIIALMVVGAVSLVGCVLLMLKACKEEKTEKAEVQVTTVTA